MAAGTITTRTITTGGKSRLTMVWWRRRTTAIARAANANTSPGGTKSGITACPRKPKEKAHEPRRDDEEDDGEKAEPGIEAEEGVDLNQARTR